jgi:hypothetical protein
MKKITRGGALRSAFNAVLGKQLNAAPSYGLALFGRVYFDKRLHGKYRGKMELPKEVVPTLAQLEKIKMLVEEQLVDYSAHVKLYKPQTRFGIMNCVWCMLTPKV